MATTTRTEERGQALAEIALCLPILCVLLLAIVQYGVMIWKDIELTGAAREGARHAVVARVEPNPVAAVESSARNALDTVDAADVDVDVVGGWSRGDRVTVTVTTPYALDIMGLQVWNGNLRSTSTVKIG
jgi:Flp pilus assembly protein TadG